MTEQKGYVSTGRLPPFRDVEDLVESAHRRFASNSEGQCFQAYPALAQVPADLFGICVVATDGAIHSAGAADHLFPIMSVSKPFVFALVCERIGPAEVRSRIGVNATGFPFNSATPLEMNPGGRTNPMVNSGAIATTSLVPGATADDKWQFILDGLSAFAGRPLTVNEEVLESVRATNFRNRELAQLLDEAGALSCGPMEAVDLYTRQCCLEVSAKDIAVMGATLARGGVNPLTLERVVDPTTCHYTLAVMATAGLYETSGDWLYEIGLPGKSGIGGGIVTVSPGKGGLGTFAPLLDEAGNSVKGQLTAKYLSQHLGMDLFLSKPEV